MNMLAVTDLATARRVELLDLDAMPHDRVAIYAARRELSVRDYGVWTILREHLWEYGSLPTGLRALAKIAGIGAASFERAAPKLAAHFDRTPQGAWTDDFLMGQRGTSLVVPSPEVNSHRSAVNKLNGARGGEAKARNARLRAGLSTGANMGAGEAESLANDGHVASNAASDERSGNGSSPEVLLADGASHVASLSVCLLDSSSEFSSKQTSEQTARAGDDARTPELAKSLANGEVKPAQSDETVVKEIVAAYDRKVDAAHVHKRLPEIREAIAKGCSLTLDIVPECRDFSRGKTVIENCFNKHVKGAAFARRAVRLKTVGAAPPMSKVYRDDPGLADHLDAALAVLGKTRSCFFQHDATGVYASFRREDWEHALARARGQPL